MTQRKPEMPELKKLWEAARKYRLILLVLLVGVLFLLIPAQDTEERQSGVHEEREDNFDVTELETRMEKVLARIDGAGDLSLMLTVKSGGEEIYALDTEYREEEDGSEERITTVLVSGEGGTKEPVVARRDYPVFQGALVVCDGGDDPSVRLLITKAVSALTGLGADKITVCK